MRLLRAVTALILASSCLASLAAQSTRQHFSFSTTFTGDPNGIFLRNTGDIQAGTVRLTSSVILSGIPVQLDLLARLEYHNGTGPFSGFITFAWLNGDELATRYVGGAELNADGSTTVTGTLFVIGGKGIYTAASGRGTVLGFRTGALGGPVLYNVNLDVMPFGGGRAAAEAGGMSNAPDPGKSSGAPAVGGGQRIMLDFTPAGLPQQQFLSDIGVGDDLRYGTWRLTGNTSSNGSPVSVELVGVLEYADGDGPFSGFVNFDLNNGSILCRYSGRANRQKDGTTVLRGNLDVYLGTGDFSGVQGSGHVIGSRAGAVGSPTMQSIELSLR